MDARGMTNIKLKGSKTEVKPYFTECGVVEKYENGLQYRYLNKKELGLNGKVPYYYTVAESQDHFLLHLKH